MRGAQGLKLAVQITVQDSCPLFRQPDLVLVIRKFEKGEHQFPKIGPLSICCLPLFMNNAYLRFLSDPAFPVRWEKPEEPLKVFVTTCDSIVGSFFRLNGGGTKKS